MEFPFCFSCLLWYWYVIQLSSIFHPVLSFLHSNDGPFTMFGFSKPCIKTHSNSNRRFQAAKCSDKMIKMQLLAGEWNGFGPERHQEFLDKYWQKRPLMIRNAFPDWEPLVTPDELAGLACADDVESRIVTEEIGLGTEEQGGTLWELEHGPFDEEIFEDLGESHWTLLVQEASRHLPEVSDLLNHPSFSFAPTWRMDDIMISYAPPQGSIGAHVDSYDVFLLQGSGKREWSIENRFVSGEEELERNIPDLDVRVLKDFSPDQSWTLEPGDMLYLPPRVPHHGVSLDKDCCTYSVGFRAPSERELLSLFTDEIGDKLVSEFAMVNDPDLTPQKNSGEVSNEAISKAKGVIKAAVLKGLEEPGFFEEWFGKFVSSPRHEHFGYPFSWEESSEAIPYAWNTPAEFVQSFKSLPQGATTPVLYRAEGLKFVYIDKGSQGCLLCVDGNVYPLPELALPFVEVLCSKHKMLPGDFYHLWGSLKDSEDAVLVNELFGALVSNGQLYPADS
mmetsp:Transcript_10108/g.13229  ORF Transcript_10108/g.13229 Transcript_10108/m.13229 type:complete len:504 (+) Transcript_10108:47-1558(+)